MLYTTSCLLTYLLSYLLTYLSKPTNNNNKHMFCCVVVAFVMKNTLMFAYVATSSVALHGRALMATIGTWCGAEDESSCCVPLGYNWTAKTSFNSASMLDRGSQSLNVLPNPIISEIWTSVNCRNRQRSVFLSNITTINNWLPYFTRFNLKRCYSTLKKVPTYDAQLFKIWKKLFAISEPYIHKTSSKIWKTVIMCLITTDTTTTTSLSIQSPLLLPSLLPLLSIFAIFTFQFVCN